MAHIKRQKNGMKSHYKPQEKRVKRQGEEQPQITKETLLKALDSVESEIEKSVDNKPLQDQLKELRIQVEGVLSNQEKEIKDLYRKIRKLEQDNEKLEARNKKMEKTLAVAQATWIWEKHVTRFVIDPRQKVFKSDWVLQMETFLHKKGTKQNLWAKIQKKLKTSWTTEHWHGINRVRTERNGMAHPDLIDLDFVESELEEMYPERRKQMMDMLEQLKMTAALMKFGRLASEYPTEESFFLQGGRKIKEALEQIRSWDRRFEQIDGLQNIEHVEATGYLAKYIDPSVITSYHEIVEYIKKRNRKRLGKLAENIAKRYHPDEMSTENEVLEILQDYKMSDECGEANENFIGIPYDIAKLHIPDFLPKRLWKVGFQILENYFN